MRLAMVVGWLGLSFLIGATLLGQQLDSSGPDQMGRCEEATFTVILINDTAQTLSDILITWERPNTDFVYVTGSSTITSHAGSPVQADPTETVVYLEWDVDALLGYGYSLPPGEAMTIDFLFDTNCSTVSGTHVATAEGTGFVTSPSDSLTVEVLPGAVRIYKNPGEIEARVGDVVTWTVTVENTGLGPVYNVVVTDALGAGLSYVAADPAPDSAAGGVITWSLGAIPSGGTAEVELQAQVLACEDLYNSADVRFGCNGEVCFDTEVDGGTATATIRLIVDNPLLDFTPPDILLPYCDPAGTTVTMAVTNVGAGPATDVRLCVDFPAELEVRNAQGGASWDGSCFSLPDLDVGESFDLTFDLVYTGDWCSAPPEGELYWEAVYQNVCGDEFRPPAEFGTYRTDYGTEGPPSLAVDLSGNQEVLICGDYSYDLTVSFSGIDACGGGTTGAIEVTVEVPDGFTVADPGGGTWTPGGDGTGGIIAWAEVDPAVGLSTTIKLTSPGSARCGQVFDLTATATTADCCGCVLTATDSIPIAVECRDLVDTVRTASPDTQEKCGTITYTTTYSFVDDPVLDDVSFNELTFIDYADNLQEYVEDSLTITIDGAPVDPVTVVDNTPGGSLEIQGIDDTSSVRGRTLVISYQMTFSQGSEPTSCPGSHTFYSWAELQLGPDCQTGDECTQYCSKSEATAVTVVTPSMNVTVEGLPNDFVDPCGTYDVTVTLTKTSDADPYGLQLRLEDLNYYIVDLGSITCSGVCPADSTPTDYGTYYQWDYGDAFVGQANGAQSALQFQVRKRCSPGAELTAAALFEDSCGYSSCSVSTSDSPAFVREPLLYIYKTPEVIYATEDTVTWAIYVTNGGAGPAYEVWVDELLGAGLVYESSSVDPDVTATVGQDHTGAPVNGATFHVPEIAPGGTREILITARMVDCTELTDSVQAGQFCGDEECIAPVEDSAYVLIPDTLLVATAYLQSPMDVCAETTADISVRNAGDPTAYHLVARTTLPPGIDYIPGSTEWQLDGGSWSPGGDPTISGAIGTGYSLKWDEAVVPGLASLPSRSTLVIRFGLRPTCGFDGGHFEAYLDYQTVCGEQDTLEVGLFYVDAARPELSVDKRQVDPPAGDPIDCGGEVTWRIEVTNTGDAVADYVWIEDTLGGGLTYVSSQGDGTYAVDDGANSGQVVTWALEDLPPGATAVLYLTAQDDGTCDALTDAVKAWWGCGDDADGSSATNDANCLTDLAAEASATGARSPDLALTGELDVGGIEPCGTAYFTLTVENSSTATAAALDVELHLPPGLSYVPGSTEIDCGAGFSSAPDPAVSGGTLVWYDSGDTDSNLCDSLPPGGTARLRFQMEAACYTSAGEIAATVYAYDCCEEDQLSLGLSTAVTPSLPQLVVTKAPVEVSLDCHDPADTVTWTITVTNSGSGTADWVRVEDTLGDSLVYVSSDPAATDLGGGVYAWELGALAPGESHTVEITAYLSRPPDSCDMDLRTDTARATWGCGTPDGDPTTGEGCESGSWTEASARVSVPDLSVSAGEVTLSCNLDGTSTLQATVRNTGEADAASVSIRVYLDGTLAHEETPDIPAGESHQLSFTSPPLKCGEEHTFRVVVDEDDEVCECDEADNGVILTITCPCPALVTTKEVVEVLRGGTPIPTDLPVQAGDVIRYRLTVTDVGGAMTFDVDLSDALPAEFLYLSGSTDASWPGGTYSADPAGALGPDLSWDTSAELGPGEALTLEFQAVVTSAVVQGEVYADTVCATGSEGEGTQIPADMSPTVPEDTDPDDCDSVSHEAAAVPALAVDKEIVDALRGGVSIWPTAAVEPGDLIHYRFTVRNVGDGIAYNVGFVDELPAGLEYDTDHADGTYTVDSPAQSGTLGIPDGATGVIYADISVQLDAGATLVADFYAYVTSAVQQGVPLENHATAAGEDGYGTPIPKENTQIGDTSDDDPDDPDPDDTGLAVIGVHEPGLALDKEIVDVLRGGASIWPTGTVFPEDVIVYRAVARNVGLGTAYDVDFQDVLPPGTEYETAFGEGTYTVDSPAQAGALGIPDGATRAVYADISVELAPGATLTIEYRVRVRPDAQPGTVLENRAEVTGDDGAGSMLPVYNPDVEDSYPDDDLAEIRVGIPALVTDKRVYVDPCRCDIPSLMPGTSFRLVLVVENVGYSTAYDIVVEDLLPRGLSYVAGSTELRLGDEVRRLEPVVAPGDRLLSWSTGLSLEPGESLSLIFSVRIDAEIAVGEILEDLMQAWGVDDLSRPIPADVSPYVPADTDPDDATLLRIKVGDPSWVEPPPTCTCRNGTGEGGE